MAHFILTNHRAGLQAYDIKGSQSEEDRHTIQVISTHVLIKPDKYGQDHLKALHTYLAKRRGTLNLRNMPLVLVNTLMLLHAVNFASSW